MEQRPQVPRPDGCAPFPDKFNLEVKKEDAFRELNFGAWEGLTYDEIVSRWPDAMANFLLHPDKLIIPQGETFAEVQERATRRLTELISIHEGDTIAIVAHGGILRTIVCYALHIPLAYLWSIRHHNTAVTIFTYENHRFTVELLNSAAHLQGT